ncbi:hypothetical protein FO519_005523 [Halicephalobus sp. NKZ332]|nr:hypothetical protein FO519_005523 [Halicephalobus sp. NKZ332]
MNLFLLIVFLLFHRGNPQDFRIIPDRSDDSNENDFDDFNVQTSYIEKGFTDSKSFTCAKVKQLLMTGLSAGDLAPDDISIVATLGDALATGVGLYPVADVEFRGAVFTTGGDANIDGLPTVSNIISEFNPELKGVSHGMGTMDKLPMYQLNVAQVGSESDTMIPQARELVRRLQMLDLTDSTMNLENEPRCSCLSKISDQRLGEVQKKWKDAFLLLEAEFNRREFPFFEVLALPLLEINVRFPELLFIAEKPLLNRRGHAFAAKWVWNRLIGGPKYNASRIPLADDSYYCPSLGCPYFRTSKNLHTCNTITLQEYNRRRATTPKPGLSATVNPKRQAIQNNVGWYIGVIVMFSATSVFILGTVFYCHGLHQTKGRFDNIQGV